MTTDFRLKLDGKSGEKSEIVMLHAKLLGSLGFKIKDWGDIK
jgi:hypothetical protein